MSLNWNASKVKDFDKLTETPDNQHIFNTITMGLMAVGIREITEQNYNEVAKRFAMIEHAACVFLYKATPEKNEPMPITLGMVKSFIGLSTNANTKTQKQFDSYCGDLLRRNVEPNH